MELAWALPSLAAMLDISATVCWLADIADISGLALPEFGAANATAPMGSQLKPWSDPVPVLPGAVPVPAMPEPAGSCNFAMAPYSPDDVPLDMGTALDFNQNYRQLCKACMMRLSPVVHVCKVS